MSGGTLWRSGAVGLALFFASAAQNLGPDLTAGRALTTAGVKQLETSLAAAPGDEHARAKLLGYYSGRGGQDPASRLARLQQIQWFIENEPDSFLLRDRSARLQPSDFAQPYASYRETLREAWRKQAGQHSDDAILFENAWASMSGTEFNVLGSANVTLEEYRSGRSSLQYLKRLRILEPADPEWALDLAGVYATTIPRGLAPGAEDNAARLARAMQGDIEKSNDVAVIGLTGALVYWSVPPLAAATPLATLSATLLRRAAALNPKNPSWGAALNSHPSAAEIGIRLAALLDITDMSPGGAVSEIAVPPGAVRAEPKDLVAKKDVKPMDGIVPPASIGFGCKVQFDSLIGRDGHIKELRMIAFERANIPFFAAERDRIRQLQYNPLLVSGKPVEAVVRIDKSCPK